MMLTVISDVVFLACEQNDNVRILLTLEKQYSELELILKYETPNKAFIRKRIQF